MDKNIDCYWDKILLGEEQAFDSLFKSLYPYLCNFAQQLLNNLPEAEETVQDAFINLWQNRTKIVINGSLKSYLYQTVHNLAINKLDHFKTHKFQPNKVINPEQWSQIHNSYTVDNSFIQAFEAKETEELILKAIEKLPEKCREIFLLSRYDNLSYEEISDKLQLSQNTIRVQIFRALETIKKFIGTINY
jgi:RNA polymerase sigma-70 factor, ECF subfamily